MVFGSFSHQEKQAFTNWPKPEGVCQALEKIFCLVSNPRGPIPFEIYALKIVVQIDPLAKVIQKGT